MVDELREVKPQDNMKKWLKGTALTIPLRLTCPDSANPSSDIDNKRSMHKFQITHLGHFYSGSAKLNKHFELQCSDKLLKQFFANMKAVVSGLC